MKHSSIEEMTLNVAPVMLNIRKEYLTDELDTWSIKMVQYDYRTAPIKAEIELVVDKETLKVSISNSHLSMKETIAFEKMLSLEKEFNIAVDLAKKYINNSYIEIE